MRAIAARLVAVAVVALAPVPAAAHGEHGSPSPLGATGAVTVEGYQVELLTHPGPLALGRESHLVARIVKTDPMPMPVSGGRVLIGLGNDSRPPEVRSASEETWAGDYAVAFTPGRLGAHQARVVLAELEGRRFDPALVVDFPVTVVPAPGMGAWTWCLIALVAGIGGGGLYAVGVRARIGASSGGAVNLLAIPWLRRLLTSPALQPSLQVPLLALMGIVVFLGFDDVQDGGVNLATKLTWTIWWAAIIFTFVLLGRVWCLACPFGALNEWASRLVAPLRRLPRPFRNIWWATGMFVVLTWADEQLGVVRSPRVTAWIVIFFAVLALVVGLRYERRSFCRYLCPIGGLIGIYSMTAPLELRSGDPAACGADCGKSCYRGGVASRGCPMLEFPHTMDRNNYCTLCAACATGCPRDNLSLRLRSFGKDLWGTGRRFLDESYLAVALVGLTLLVTAQMLTAWPASISAAARWLPPVVRAGLRPVTYLGLVESGLLLGGALVVGPLLVLAGTGIGDRLAGPRALGLRRAFVTFGYMFVPVGLGMHLAHNLGHLLLEGGGIVPAVQRAVTLYTPFSLGEADWQALPLAPAPVVEVLQMSVVVGFCVLSLVAGHRISMRAYADARVASRALIPAAVLALAFTVAGIVLLSQPMGMRHAM